MTPFYTELCYFLIFTMNLMSSWCHYDEMIAPLSTDHIRWYTIANLCIYDLIKWRLIPGEIRAYCFFGEMLHLLQWHLFHLIFTNDFITLVLGLLDGHWFTWIVAYILSKFIPYTHALEMILGHLYSLWATEFLLIYFLSL